MWNRLTTGISNTANDFNRGLTGGIESIKSDWANIKVQCPSCSAVVKPPANARVFACSYCGVNIARPSFDSRCGYHSSKTVKEVGGLLSDLIGRTKPLQVVVPEAVTAGQTLRVDTGNATVNVKVPRDLNKGEVFVAQVPATAIPDTPLPAQEAPSNAPVAQGASNISLSIRRQWDEQRRVMQDAETASTVSTESRGLRGVITNASSGVYQGVESVDKGMRGAWNDINVRCPSCNTVLEVPDAANVKVFACNACGKLINKPDIPCRLDYHLMKVGRSIGDVFGAAVGATKPLRVQVPDGVSAGDPIQVPGGFGNPITVVVPEGVQPGQVFIAQIPARQAVTQVSIVGEAAPSVVPVAQQISAPLKSELDTSVADHAAPKMRATPSISMAPSSSSSTSVPASSGYPSGSGFRPDGELSAWDDVAVGTPVAAATVISRNPFDEPSVDAALDGMSDAVGSSASSSGQALVIGKPISAGSANVEAAAKEAAEKAALEAAEKEAAEEAAREAAEKAVRQAGEKEAAEIAARESAEKEAAEKAAIEAAAKEAAEKVAREAAEKEAAEHAARESAEKQAAEKTTREAAEKEAAEKAAREAAEKEAAEKAAREAADKEAAEIAARESAEKEAAEKAAEKDAAEKTAREAIEKEAAEKVPTSPVCVSATASSEEPAS